MDAKIGGKPLDGGRFNGLSSTLAAYVTPSTLPGRSFLRFYTFGRPWVVFLPDQNTRVGDRRYGLLSAMVRYACNVAQPVQFGLFPLQQQHVCIFPLRSSKNQVAAGSSSRVIGENVRHPSFIGMQCTYLDHHSVLVVRY